MSFWRDRQGAASTLIGIVTVMMAMMLLAPAFDAAFLYARRNAIKQALDNSENLLSPYEIAKRLADMGCLAPMVLNGRVNGEDPGRFFDS